MPLSNQQKCLPIHLLGLASARKHDDWFPPQASTEKSLRKISENTRCMQQNPNDPIHVRLQDSNTNRKNTLLHKSLLTLSKKSPRKTSKGGIFPNP